MFEKIKTFLRNEWAQASTKLGLLLTFLSTAAPQLAQIDVRFAYAGAAAGALLMLWRGNPSA